MAPQTASKCKRAKVAFAGEDTCMQNIKILTSKEVCQLVRYSKRHLDRLIAQGTFPAPIQLGPKKIGWIETEVLEWLHARPRRHSDVRYKTTGVAHV